METAFNRKHSSASSCWLLATSWPERLGQEIRALMHIQVGEVSTIVVPSPKTAKEVMKTHDINYLSQGLILLHHR